MRGGVLRQLRDGHGGVKVQVEVEPRLTRLTALGFSAS